MDVFETINNRISLRTYKEKPITDEHMNMIIESALRAPTAGNMMLYSIVVVKDAEIKKKLSISCDNQPFIEKAPAILIFLADMQRCFDYYNYSGVKEYCDINSLDFTSPNEANFLLSTSDAIIAAQNAVIAAEALGIGSCYIGDIIENCELHKELFNLPDLTIPVGMLCLGYYPDNYSKKLSTRFDKKYIVFNERYSRLTADDFKDMYKDNEALVTSSNIFKAKNFGQLMYARKTGTSFSREMNRSLNLMLKKWTSTKI